MKKKEINLKQLKKLNYKSKKIKEELACNLINNLKKGINSFPGIEGYDKTVIPDIERAILSGHDINFLGLRGQAKTKIARILVNLLDEWIPIINGNELNDDPLNPISVEGKNCIEKFAFFNPRFLKIDIIEFCNFLAIFFLLLDWIINKEFKSHSNFFK